MIRIFSLFLLVFCLNLSAQTPCLPFASGLPAGNDPPGCFLCGPIYQGSTVGYNEGTVSFDFPCGEIENSQWISILADQSGTLQITGLSSNCELNKGIEFAIYNKDLNIVSNCFSSGGNNFPGNVTASGLIPGEIYYLMLDGFEGDQCDFLISQSTSVHGPSTPIPSNISFAAEDANPCPGDTVCYNLSPMNTSLIVDWTTPNNSKIISGGLQNDNYICVEYLNHGASSIKANVRSSCFPDSPIIPAPIELNVNVAPIINLTSTTLCPGEFIEIDSIRYDSSIQTDIIFPLAASSGCDSILRIDLTISDTTPTEIICTHDSFLNALTVEWIEPAGAEEYELFINDSLASKQNHNTYIFQPKATEDSTKIKLLPSNSNGCNFQKTEITCANPKLSSIKRVEKEQLRLVPNPTKNTVRIDSDLKIEGVQVFDFSGRKILFSKEKEIDLSAFEAGIYVFKIKTKDEFFIKKVIKI